MLEIFISGLTLSCCPISILENKSPMRNSVKSEMISWLEKNNVPFAAEMRKTELFQLAERHKRPEKTFRIDQVLKFHGHNVLRLPPYMCDLSPIELAWAKVNKLIREKNVAGEMSLSVLKDVTMDAVANSSSPSCKSARCYNPRYQPTSTSSPPEEHQSLCLPFMTSAQMTA
jgi:hypothetical protein